jgi:hypothetical protein
MILTDGAISDLENTIEQIVIGSSLPLSIIIVGVGRGDDFDSMEQLDGDVAPLYSNKLRAYRNRDIVQFVAFKDLVKDPARLAKEVLKEVPRQMTNYFIQKNIKPNPKKTAQRQWANLA